MNSSVRDADLRLLESTSVLFAQKSVEPRAAYVTTSKLTLWKKEPCSVSHVRIALFLWAAEGTYRMLKPKSQTKSPLFIRLHVY